MTSTYIICSLCGDSVTAEGYASGSLLTCDMCSDEGDTKPANDAEQALQGQLDDDYEEFADLDRGVRRR
jgi:hypothetical protein